jgi:hypothetical protein
VVGGVIMGAGFIMGGFCPGTGVCALGLGTIDALCSVLGGLTGAFLFAETYPWIQPLADGAFRGPVKINEVFGISPGLFTFLMIAVAIGMFWLAELAEKKFAKPEITNEI